MSSYIWSEDVYHVPSSAKVISLIKRATREDVRLFKIGCTHQEGNTAELILRANMKTATETANSDTMTKESSADVHTPTNSATPDALCAASPGSASSLLRRSTWPTTYSTLEEDPQYNSGEIAEACPFAVHSSLVLTEDMTTIGSQQWQLLHEVWPTRPWLLRL
ncbi:hypothetical protein FOMPIDRAFT_116013 [Fomitopsis schrenkii]|uniref:Uncharacterized protein n=1 Tax=Fomitopsis schrenkii TaxID=2126942 RepID=S8DIR6_FOMSC|nr:hypothetical protein FOMPIDRAFT_116013 [Fomitopsis schrenkii]